MEQNTFTLNLDVLEDLHESFQDWSAGMEEVGSSDVNCFLHNFLRNYGVTADDVQDYEWTVMQRVATGRGLMTVTH